MGGKEYDVAVIGGGAGGLFAASGANAVGARTCIIEKKRLGGDCTWFGCVPSKAIVKSAQAAHKMKTLGEFGLGLRGDAALDTGAVMAHVRDVVGEISTHHPPELFEKRGIKIIIGAPKFLDAATVEVGGDRITARRFIICTGSHPAVPPIEGLGEIDYLTNENIFDLETPPASLIVLGGGPIGVELSQALNRLGTTIYLVEMRDRILPREDPELAGILEKRLAGEGINLLTGNKAVRFRERDGKVHLAVENGEGSTRAISADRVLVAVGRSPSLDGLSLESAGVEYTKKGISLNSYLQTTNRNIFACGDVASPYQFSHMAAYQAQICVRNALFRRPVWQKANYSNVPWATFTDPELAHLGMTEEEARRAGGKIRVYTNGYGGSDRAVTDRETEGLLKVITDRKGRILGAHIVGAHASEIIQGFLIAKSLRIPLSRLASPIFIYPTLSELVKKTAAKPLLEKLGSPWVKKALRILKRN